MREPDDEQAVPHFAADPERRPSAGRRARGHRWPLTARLFGLAWRALAAAVVCSVGLVLLLRVVDPPTSAFMLAARWEAWRAGRTDFVLAHRWVSREAMSPALVLAVVAAEDQRFPLHAGFDWAALRAAMEHNRRGGTVRGGSTLTQQVAKNLFLWAGRSWLRKGLEAWFTVLIEQLWTKRRIVEVYLNVAQFGDGVYGVEAAARRWFDRPASALGPREAALLAAVLPNPLRYRVEAPSARVSQRRAFILRQMEQLGPGHVAGL